MKRLRPNVIRIAAGIYRLDLRGKSFDRVRQIVSDGKKSLEFCTQRAAAEKADEVEKMLSEYGQRKLETFDLVLKEDPLALQARLTPFGKTIRDAVLFYEAHLKDQAEKEKSQTLGKLADDWLAEKKRRLDQNTMRPATYETLHYKVNGANGYKAQWGTRPVATITGKEIEDWIEDRRVAITERLHVEASQMTKVHQLAYLSQFFIWCKKKHGVPKENPCENIVIERNDDMDPRYFTPDECRDILTLSMSKRFLSLLPFHCICLFAGVRTTEARRLEWDNIDFEDKAIVIKKSDAKTRKHRRVEMQPNLLEWLTWFQEKYPKYSLIPPTGMTDKIRAFRKALTVQFWHKNGMRHSYASYILGARRGDFAYLEQHMGNSRTMLQNHYVNYPTKEDSEDFWSITPTTIQEKAE